MDQKKETSTQNPPRSVCEKIFNAFSVHNSAFRPIRRLTFKQQEPAATASPPAPNLSPPKKPQVVVENEKKPPLDIVSSSSFSPKIEPQTTTTPPAPPKKPSHDVAQVQTPSKVEIQNIAPKEEKKLEIVPKVPVIPPPPESRKPNKSSTRKEETPPVALPVSLPAAPTPPKVEVAPQAQLTKPAPPPAPAKATEVRRQPQRTETKNIDGKADDYISRIRNKLRSTSAAEKTTST
ncbi:hypothetical protein J5N97_013051 [Dioscorea zingiberensis]|uniref:Uncharacterized protein n=1 Tax=Dioscorea zingiberensis TaxID=325984 RepID=A0A9D5CS82_9LILI|nr:hypothetical protein J5N97_013051 [Dioscorea zingiberensis]